MIKIEFHFNRNTIEGGTLIAVLLIVFIVVITILLII